VARHEWLVYTEVVGVDIDFVNRADDDARSTKSLVRELVESYAAVCVMWVDVGDLIRRTVVPSRVDWRSAYVPSQIEACARAGAGTRSA
jgi:hypothetical protein